MYILHELHAEAGRLECPGTDSTQADSRRHVFAARVKQVQPVLLQLLESVSTRQRAAGNGGSTMEKCRYGENVTVILKFVMTSCLMCIASLVVEG